MTNWDQRYYELATHYSTWSKDPSTKVGAVAVANHGRVLSYGYNGFPRGIEDTEERLNHRPTKYEYMVHAEMNVIFNACYNGVSLNRSTLYVYPLPICSECALGVIQVGIRRVVVTSPKLVDSPKWSFEWKRSVELFREAGIEFMEVGQNTWRS